MQFTSFERDLMRWYADHASDPSILTQVEASLPRKRDYSGVGLFVDLRVPEGTQSLPQGLASPLSGPGISSSVLRNGAGSILFHENGFLTMLEVYTYDDPMSDDLPDYEFERIADQS